MSDPGDLPPPLIPPSGDGKEARPEFDDLPPPVFAPGSPRGEALRARMAPEATPEPGGFPDDAFIDPDEPISRTASRFSDDAFIDPDEPIVRDRPPEVPDDFERVLRGDDDSEEIVVTGMGDDPHLDGDDFRDLRTYGDPQVADLVRMVGELARALKEKGEAGLRASPEMSRFEATLRAYCTGYLAGQRELVDQGF